MNANNRLGYCLAGLEKPRPDAKPVPVPERHGEPSVFEHVIYVIKENRTYDQVFGDMKEGNGDPTLCIFGEDVTPNHHKLAREFILLDNFYCCGVLSADGHSWVNEAYVTDYLEKQFGSSRAATPTRAATRSRSRPAASSGTTPWPQEDVPQLRRVRQEQLTSPRTPGGATCTPTIANGTSEGEGHGHAEPPLARPVHAPELPRLPADRRRTSTGPSSSSTS